MTKACSTVMVQGTASDAGKSTVVAGFCRVLARRQIPVVPFKPQNMALNSAVTEDGGEIGRAQALQAQACGLAPHTDMNPILLKPSSDVGAQVIIHGQVYQNMDATVYHDYKTTAMKAVLTSHQRLSENYQSIVVEGAGSPAEINLREGDIANMGFAEAVDCPVILVADIDKGGVFAQIVGTLELLSESEASRVVGFIINRFRGDISLLQSGLDWLEARTGKPVLGVLPYLHNLFLDSEDSIDTQQAAQDSVKPLEVVVPVLPRISNHTDFDPLRVHPGVNLTFVGQGELGEDQALPPCDLIILPGSKNVRHDLQWLNDNHWPQAIARHLRYGGKIMGICGGYQMLGELIDDPEGIESTPGVSSGLGLLPLTTTLRAQKALARRTGILNLGETTSSPKPSKDEGVSITGYEIHCGETRALKSQPNEQDDTGKTCTENAASKAPIVFDNGESDGAVSDDGQIFGTYLHGLLDSGEACSAILSWAGAAATAAQAQDFNVTREAQINRVADTMEAHLDWPRLETALSDFWCSDARQNGCENAEFEKNRFGKPVPWGIKSSPQPSDIST